MALSQITLPELTSDYPLSTAQAAAYRENGHILLRVSCLAKKRQPTGRISRRRLSASTRKTSRSRSATPTARHSCR